MGTCVIQLILVLCFYNSVLSIHTSDKLDFGDTPHRATLVKSENKLPVKVTRTVDSITSPSKHISVSCGPTGCNSTNKNHSVETEVVVRVKTNVNLDKSQDKIDVDDVSDVPIVVGYRGSTTDETPNEEEFRSYSPFRSDPNDVSSRSDYIPLRPLYPNSPISIGEGNRRLTDSSLGEGYGRYGSSSEIPYRYGSLNYGSQNGYSGSTFSTTPSPYGHYGSTSTTRIPNRYYDPSSSRAEIPNRYYDTSNPGSEILNNYHDTSSPRTVEINGVTSSLSSLLPDLNRRNYDYNTFKNGEDLRIPYFEHTYNKHYFSEEPPPHTVLYPKSNTFNPVEFRNIPKNKWRPSFWNDRPNKYAFNNDRSNFINPYTHNHNYPIPYSHTHQRGHGDTNCACREQRPDDESNPYTAASVNHHIAVQNKDPGASIDDKLAPLN